MPRASAICLSTNRRPNTRSELRGPRELGGLVELAPQQAAEGFDADRGPVGEVGEGAVLDLAVVAKGFAQEDGGRGVAVGDGGDIHDFCISLRSLHVKENICIYMTTKCLTNHCNALGHNNFSGLLRGRSVYAQTLSQREECGFAPALKIYTVDLDGRVSPTIVGYLEDGQNCLDANQILLETRVHTLEFQLKSNGDLETDILDLQDKLKQAELDLDTAKTKIETLETKIETLEMSDRMLNDTLSGMLNHQFTASTPRRPVSKPKAPVNPAKAAASKPKAPVNKPKPTVDSGKDR